MIHSENQSFKLTLKEGNATERYLLQHQNRLVKREEILTQVWGENDYFPWPKHDVFVSRLRKVPLLGDFSDPGDRARNRIYLTAPQHMNPTTPIRLLSFE